MSHRESGDSCDFCDKGKVITRAEEIAFHQWTARGYVHCKVQIPMGTCDRCGAKHWNEAADVIIEQAVQREYDRLE